MVADRGRNKGDDKGLMSFIPYSRQWINDDDINEVTEVLRSDIITRGTKAREFEEMLAGYCGAKYCVIQIGRASCRERV